MLPMDFDLGPIVCSGRADLSLSADGPRPYPSQLKQKVYVDFLRLLSFWLVYDASTGGLRSAFLQDSL